MSVYKKNSLITLDMSYQLMTSLQIHSKWTKLQTMSPLQRMTFDHFYNLQDITAVSFRILEQLPVHWRAKFTKT